MAREVLLLFDARIATVQLIEQMLEHLGGTTGLRTRSRLITDLHADDLTPGTFPLFLRASSIAADRLARDLRGSDVAYGYYLDDNFWLLDPATPIGSHYADSAHRRRLDEIIRGASTVIASTPLLRDYLTRLNRRVINLDSFFDFSLVPELPRPHRARMAVRAGFAGSRSRVADLAPLLDDVLGALDAHPDLEFEVIGLDRSALPKHPRIRRFDYRSTYADYVQFQRSRGWDFALAPLGSVASNLYKTDNKFREYAAQGIPGIYQDAAPYASVRDGETGLLAGTTRSWRAAIDTYMGDPELRTRVRIAARADAEARCSIDAVAPAWDAFFRSAPGMAISPRRLHRLQGRIASRQTALRRVLHRLHLLSAYGLEEWRRDGFARTFGRTVRFLGNRVRGR